MFKEYLGLEEQNNISDLFTQVHTYINYENNLLAGNVKINKARDNKFCEDEDK